MSGGKGGGGGGKGKLGAMGEEGGKRRVLAVSFDFSFFFFPFLSMFSFFFFFSYASFFLFLFPFSFSFSFSFFLPFSFSFSFPFSFFWLHHLIPKEKKNKTILSHSLAAHFPLTFSLFHFHKNRPQNSNPSVQDSTSTSATPPNTTSPPNAGHK